MKTCDACRIRTDRRVSEAHPLERGGDRDPLLDSPVVSQEEPHDNHKLSCGICAMFPSCMSILSRRDQPPAAAAWPDARGTQRVRHVLDQLVHGGCRGVFEITPRDERELGEQFRFRQSVHIGYTDFSEDEVRRLVAELGKQFRGDRYHLMNNNCNHFTSALLFGEC
ncbi:hypothetical protein ACJJTC_006860 [Scirpophaga incertulas]